MTVDLGHPQQAIDAFGVNANVHSWHDGELRPAIDAIAAIGANTWRVIIDKADWEDTNDDADPATSTGTTTTRSTRPARWPTSGTRSPPSSPTPASG